MGSAPRNRERPLTRRRKALRPHRATEVGTAREGLLVLLVGPEGRGKDMLIAGARRRFGTDPAFAFPSRISTRPAGTNDTHISISRRTFSGLEAEGRLFATWTCGGHSFGIAKDVRGLLSAGAIVVAAATQEAVSSFRAGWERVHVIDVRTGPDGFRPRMAFWSGPVDAKDVSSAARVHLVAHGGDAATAARQLYGLLEMLRAGDGQPDQAAMSRGCLAPPGPLAFRRRPPEMRAPTGLVDKTPQ